MKLITILFCLTLLISGALAAETKLPPNRINWSQMLPEDANIILNGGDIQGQEFATEYDTIVYPNADFTDIYAVYGGNRTLIDSGTIGSAVNTRVIRAGVNATPENGKMLIAGGPYSLEADLNCTTGAPSYVNYYDVALPITKNIYIEGLGRNATTLRLAPSQYSDTKRGLLIYIYCPYTVSGDGVGTAYTNLGLEHMTLDGDVGNQTPYYHDGAGVLLVGSVRGQARFNDLEIKNSPNHGMYLGYNGGGWERNSVVRDVYCHDNWGSSQIDNTENLVVDGFISENDSWGMWTASRKALVLDGMYGTSGHSIVSNVHIIDGSMFIFGYWKSRDDLSLRLSNLYIDSEDIGKHGIYIQHCNNVTISDGTIVAGTGNYAASVTNSTGITFDDLELRGKRSLVVEAGYRSDVKVNGCDLNASEDVFRIYGAGSTALFTGCDLNTSSAAAYLINVQAGAKASLIGCHGSDNGLIYVSSSSGVLEHSGTSGLGLEAYGATSVADGGTIAHGMKITPTYASADGTLAGTNAVVTAKDATHLTIDLDGVTTTQIVNWEAKY